MKLVKRCNTNTILEISESRRDQWRAKHSLVKQDHAKSGQEEKTLKLQNKLGIKMKN